MAMAVESAVANESDGYLLCLIIRSWRKDGGDFDIMNSYPLPGAFIIKHSRHLGGQMKTLQSTPSFPAK